MDDYVPVNTGFFDAQLEVGSYHIKFSRLGKTELMCLLSLLKYGSVESSYTQPSAPTVIISPHVRPEAKDGN